jgi:hypothetical protein
MSLLLDIQTEAVSAKPNAIVILRRCLVLASHLQHEPLRKWAQDELNGYASHETLPDYRVCQLQSYGNFRNRHGQGLDNVAIPTILLPEAARAMASHVYLMEGVAAYVDTLDRERESFIQYAWKAEHVQYIAPQLNLVTQDARLVEAWHVVPMSSIANLVDSVITRALNFSIAIAAENPGAGEATMGSNPPISLDRVNQIFNQTIFFNGQHNVSIASSDFSQNIASVVIPGDIESLLKAMTELGVGNDELTHLRTAVDQDRKSGSSGQGPRVTDWFGSLAKKAAEEAAKNVASGGVGTLGDRLPEIIQALQSFFN